MNIKYEKLEETVEILEGKVFHVLNRDRQFEKIADALADQISLDSETQGRGYKFILDYSVFSISREKKELCDICKSQLISVPRGYKCGNCQEFFNARPVQSVLYFRPIFDFKNSFLNAINLSNEVYNVSSRFEEFIPQMNHGLISQPEIVIGNAQPINCIGLTGVDFILQMCPQRLILPQSKIEIYFSASLVEGKSFEFSEIIGQNNIINVVNNKGNVTSKKSMSPEEIKKIYSSAWIKFDKIRKNKLLLEDIAVNMRYLQ